MRLSDRAAFAVLKFIENVADSDDLNDPNLMNAVGELRANKIHARHLRRRPGRPRKGRLQISKKRFDELPSLVSLSEASRILGISYETLRRWSKQPNGFPTTNRGRYNCLYVERQDLKDFLIATERDGN